MNLEDRYHAAKNDSWLTIEATSNVPEFSLKKTVEASSRVRALVDEIGEGGFRSVENGSHTGIRLNETTAQLDHRKVGGPMFMRLGEALLDSPHRPLPQCSLLQGLLSVAWHLAYLLSFFWRSGCDNVQSRELIFARKRYEMPATERRHGSAGIRFAVYHAFLRDALVILGKDELSVGFSVVFEGGSHVNEVGLVLIHFDASMTVNDLKLAFHKRAGVGAAVNVLARFSRFTKHLLRHDGRSVREKLDLIITAIVADTDTHVELSIRAAGPVYEGAYVSLVSRVANNGDVRVLATVSSHNAAWKAFESTSSKKP